MSYKVRETKYKTVPCSVSFDKELLAKLKAYCSAEGISLSKLINNLLKRYAREKGIIK